MSLQTLLFTENLLHLAEALRRLGIYDLGCLNTIYLGAFGLSKTQLSAQKAVFRTKSKAIIVALVCGKPAQLFFQHAVTAIAEHIRDCFILNGSLAVRKYPGDILRIIRRDRYTFRLSKGNAARTAAV